MSFKEIRTNRQICEICTVNDLASLGLLGPNQLMVLGNAVLLNKSLMTRQKVVLNLKFYIIQIKAVVFTAV